MLGRDLHPDIPCASLIHGNEEPEGVPKMPEDALRGAMVCLQLQNGPHHRCQYPARQTHQDSERVPLNEARELHGGHSFEGEPFYRRRKLGN